MENIHNEELTIVTNRFHRPPQDHGSILPHALQFIIPFSAAEQFVFCPQSTDKKNNSVALVHERTIRTKRLPLVGEASANFYG
jgi:hypothetical protein